jgi:hypothetical protein
MEGKVLAVEEVRQTGGVVAAIRELNRKDKNRWSLLAENTQRHWVKHHKGPSASGSGVGVAARLGNTIGADTNDKDAEAVRSTCLLRPVLKQLRRSTKTQIRAGVMVTSRASKSLWEGNMVGLSMVSFAFWVG